MITIIEKKKNKIAHDIAKCMLIKEKMISKKMETLRISAIIARRLEKYYEYDEIIRLLRKIEGAKCL